MRIHDALATVDTLRDDPSARSEVLRTYLEHREHLAPATPEGTERLRFLLEHVPRTTQGLEELFAETAASALDPYVADRALVGAATFAVARSDLETAHVRLREALMRRRGTDTAIERSACINLARLLIVEHRNAEALLVARRAATMVVTDDETCGRAAVLGVLATALARLGEAEAAGRVTTEIGALIPTDTNDAGMLAIQGIVGWLRMDIAHTSGRLDEAIWRLDTLRARENPTSPTRKSAYAGQRARILLDAGRASEAVLALAGARTTLPDVPQDDVRFAILEACAAAGCDELEMARERAEYALALASDLIEIPGPHRFWVAELVSVFSRLGDVERGRRCLEILATEHLEQIARIDRSASDIPELAGETSPEDRAILRRARERAIVESRDTLAAFAALVEPAIRRGDARALVLTPKDDGFVRVCAWCTRIAGTSGSWLPLGHLIPTDGALRTTHGACPECLRDNLGKAVPTT